MEVFVVRISRAHFLRLCLPLTALAAGAGLAGCNTGGAGGSGAGGEILVGHYASLTGDTATFGQGTDDGIKLAAKEINAAGGVGGKTIRVETQDDRSDPQEAKTVVTRFAANPNMAAVLGEVSSTRSLIAAPVLERAGIPMITPSSTNDRVTRVGPHIFRVCFTDTFQGYAAAKFARDNLKLDRVAIFRDRGSAYSIGLADSFRKVFTGRGGTIVADVSYKATDTDFRSQIVQAKVGNPQAFFVPGYYGEVGTIAQQAREQEVKVPLMGGDGWDSPELVEGAGGPGGALEGSYFANHYTKDNPDPQVQAFVKAYRDAYKRDPSALAALGYDAMKILADAIRRAGSADREAITRALAQTKGFKGVTGTITIDENRNASKPAVIVQIKGSEFAAVDTVPPQGGSAGTAEASAR